jgi:2-enoate reductase
MKLFEPGHIGTLALKNRIIMAPMRIGSIVESDGNISRRGIDYFIARAKGGAAMIMIGLVRIEREIEKIPPVHWHDLMTDSHEYVPRLGELADAVHDYGAKLCLQLSAGWGRNAYVHLNRTIGARSPSTTPCFRDPNIMAEGLTIQEIEQLVRAYQFSAEICRTAGIDCVEMHGHDGYLFDAFTDSLWNQRNDKYGGDFDRRLTFALETIEAIKRGAGADFPILYRLALLRDVDRGRGAEEGLEICRRLERAGVAALDVDIGTYEVRYWPIPPTTQPPGCMIPFAAMAKKAVNIPVIVAGKLGYPDLAESVLQEGKADFIALARSLLADPEWPNKAKAGQWEDIRPCIGDNEGCLGRQSKGKYLSCTVNPAVGMEKELALRQAEKKKRVLVIGGGPAGLEASRVAAERGHKVTLWEKNGRLGGALIAAAIPDFKKDYQRLIEYLSLQAKKVGVDIKLNRKAAADAILRDNPDVVFVATGSTPIIPKIPGVSKAVTAVDVLLGKSHVGNRVVIIGGGLVGTETALYLARQGKKVVIIEILDKIISDMFMSNRQHMIKLLGDAQVKILTETRVLEITESAIIVLDKNEMKTSLEADTVILASGMEPHNSLLTELQGKIPEVYNIGDSAEPRRVLEAIWGGFRIARIV